MSSADAADQLAHFLWRRDVLVLTGAGCSTESGIPDYRGPQTKDKPRRPVQFLQFMKHERMRRRYWARSTVGWPRFRAFLPNPAHHALASLQRTGACEALLTQNVDRLHHSAGSPAVIELHGALQEVVCMGCGEVSSRDALQDRIHELNPSFRALEMAVAPDGDADISEEMLEQFVVPPCARCDGVLKPHVVLFGENVPRARVDESFRALERCDALLVVGSSLAVFSGYRFALRARERGIPVALLNLGASRADGLAELRIDAYAGEVLPRVAELLGAVSEAARPARAVR